MQSLNSMGAEHEKKKNVMVYSCQKKKEYPFPVLNVNLRYNSGLYTLLSFFLT